MEAARGETHELVPLANRRSVDHEFPLDDTHAEADDLEIAIPIDTRHGRGLATEQGATRALAALGDAAQGVCGDLAVELAHCEVVEEDHGFGPLDHQVVHDHRHAVNADRVEAADLPGQAQLGSDAVGRRDPNGVLISLRGLEHARKAADRGEHFGSGGAADDLLHVVDEGLVVIEVDSRPGVAGRRVCRSRTRRIDFDADFARLIFGILG